MGTYEISASRHARDWIDTSRLLEERTYLARIVEEFVQVLRRELGAEAAPVIVGEGYPGLVLASHIGFVGGFRTTYVVPPREEKERTSHERTVEIPDGADIVLVCDVVAEGTTLGETINFLESEAGVQKERLKLILTVFRRKPYKESDLLPDEIAAKVRALNSGFDIQLCRQTPADCLLLSNDLVKVINRTILDHRL